jgi:hypothetical protein
MLIEILIGGPEEYGMPRVLLQVAYISATKKRDKPSHSNKFAQLKCSNIEFADLELSNFQ